MSQSPAVMTAGERRSRRRITVASLCCDVEGANSPLTASTKSHRSYRPKAFSKSDETPIQALCQKLERSGLAATLPLLPPVHSQYHDGLGAMTQTFPFSRFDTTKNFVSAYDLTDSAGGGVLLLNRATSALSIIHIGAVHHHDRPWSMIVPPSSTPPTTAGRGKIPHTDHDANLLVRPTTQTAFTESRGCTPQHARPSYSEEKRFFIMYYRIVRELPWPEIENGFASFFNPRTKDGLTSVYYRIRKIWGMDKVLNTDKSSMCDRDRVESEASRFSRDFLIELGYFD